MRPLLHPTLINGRSGDPALYVETLFEQRALLFDLGDITALPPRKILRLEHVFVSHAHIDHFVGFDLVLVVTEIDATLATRTVRFRLRNTFAAEELGRGPLADGVVHRESTFRVS